MTSLWQDVRFAFRSLARTKSVTLVAVLTLALGIGANTAIFSVINAVLLEPLPFRDSGKLVRLYETESAPGEYPITGPDYLEWKQNNKTFSQMSFFSWAHAMNLSGADRAEKVVAVPTEANFFSVLGAAPLLGRAFASGEDQPGHLRVTVLSYGLWKSYFNADPTVVGRDVQLDGSGYTVVGVMKPTFEFPTTAQLWVPQDMSTKGIGQRGNHGPGAIGRLKPGVTVEQASADLEGISRRLQKDFPDTNYKVDAIVRPLHDDLVGNSRASLLLMLGAVVLVLLIACANVANLLLAKTMTRQREMAVRTALGATRWRLVRQLLTESVVLALASAALGLCFAIGGIKLLTSLKSLAIPPTNPVQLSMPVLLFTFAVAVVAGILFGSMPALRASRTQMYDELKRGAGGAAIFDRQNRLTSNTLVVGEVALSLVLLICASLLIKDFMALRSTSIGVRTDHIWTGQVRLPQAKYPGQHEQFAAAQAMLERVRQLPGVKEAAITDTLPVSSTSNGYVKLPGHENDQTSGPLVEWHSASPEYFKAFAIPVLAGRGFTQQDLETEIRLDDTITALTKDGAQPKPEQTRDLVYPSVINHSMAKAFWPGESAVGKIYTTGDAGGPWHQVVGVVGDVKEWGLALAAHPESYDVYDGGQQVIFVLHTSVDPESITPAVHDAVSRFDETLPLYNVRTMQDWITRYSAGAQFMSTLLGVFAGLALLLASIGIYGVLSYLVTQRTREIGIRMSLGATQHNVVVLVLWQGLKLAGIGFCVGIVAAYSLRKVMASSLSIIHASDVSSYIVMPVVLALVAVLACFAPAMRAAKIEPMTAIREA